MTEDEEFSLLEHRIKRLEQMRGKLQTMPNEAAKETNMYPPLNDVNNAANDRQEGGDHYARQKVQPWEAMEAWMTPDQFQGFLLGSAIAYLARFNTEGVEGKGGVLDIKKARHYCEKLISVIEKKDGTA